MVVTMLLLWFPIVLAVGLGGRLLSRGRGVALGLLCTLFWVVLLQANVGVAIWMNPWTVLTVLAGSVAVVAIGGWSGACAVSHSMPSSGTGESSGMGVDEIQGSLAQIATAIDHFDDWINHHRDDGDPWPSFDELVRLVMYRCCRAVHVKTYRLCSDNAELIPLATPGSLEQPATKRLSARSGIIGHVITTGRTYVSGEQTQGPLVERLAESTDAAPAWCFAVNRGAACLGAVTVARLRIAPREQRALMNAMERLINQFWNTLVDVCSSRTAMLDDPVSGLPARDAFLRTAGRSLADSYRQVEPVAVAVIALEQLRELNDKGRWELADELVREVGNTLRRKLRTDDELGRFDGSRFVLLLRRVDSHLATLIVKQVLERLTDLCGDVPRWGTKVVVRCGVVGSGTVQPDLRTLVSRALLQCHRARTENLSMASDLPEAEIVEAVVS